MICKRTVIPSKPVATTLRSGPGSAKPGNERFMKESLMKIISSKLKAKTFKSDSEAGKLGNQEFVREWFYENDNCQAQTWKSGCEATRHGNEGFVKGSAEKNVDLRT